MLCINVCDVCMLVPVGLDGYLGEFSVCGVHGLCSVGRTDPADSFWTIQILFLLVVMCLFWSGCLELFFYRADFTSSVCLILNLLVMQVCTNHLYIYVPRI